MGQCQIPKGHSTCDIAGEEAEKKRRRPQSEECMSRLCKDAVTRPRSKRAAIANQSNSGRAGIDLSKLQLSPGRIPGHLCRCSIVAYTGLVHTLSSRKTNHDTAHARE